MRGDPRFQRWPTLVRTTWALAAMLAAAACGKTGEAGKSAEGAASDAAAGQSVPVIAIIRAADWIGTEWSEDALKVGLQESELEQGRDYEFKVVERPGRPGHPAEPDRRGGRRQGEGDRDPPGRDAAGGRPAGEDDADRLQHPVGPVRGRRRHQRLEPPRQHHRRLLARLRRSGAGQARRADQAHRAQGQARRYPVQPGRAALGRAQGPDDRSRPRRPGSRSRRCRSTA